MMRYPRLLDDNMNERDRLMPNALSANMSELHGTLPTATLVVSEDTAVSVRDFVEVYGENGSLGIFRVSSVGQLYGESRECNLTHALITLQDSILRGQGTLSSDPKTAMETLLNAQAVKRWKIGKVEATESIAEPMEYDNTNVYDGIKTVISLLPEYTFFVDQTAYPWTLNVVKKSQDVRSEGRLARNISSLRVTVDDSELCTRLVLDGGDRYWDADTIGTWGEVARTISTGSDINDDATGDEIEAFLAEKVAAYFEKHKNPTVTVEIDGLDFSAVTGEALDSISPGNMYRLALPDYDTTIIERVVSVSYADLLGAPRQATIYLNNRTEDASTRMAGLMVSVMQVEKTVEKTVKSLDGTMAGLRAFYDEFLIENENWKHTISEVSVQLNAVESTLDLKANRSELTGVSNRLSDAEILIDGLNAKLELKADLSVTDDLGERLSQAEIDIDGANAEIALKVNKNGVIAAINVSSEEVTIAAKKINLSGYVTTSKLSSELASITNQISTSISTSSISAANAKFTNIEFGGAALRLRTKSFVTEVTLPTFYGKYITYMDDTADIVQQYVLTGVNKAGSVTTESLVYCGTTS